MLLDDDPISLNSVRARVSCRVITLDVAEPKRSRTSWQSRLASAK